MRTTIISIILLLVIAISSCKKAENAEEVKPISTFDSPFPKNNKKLTNILGDELILKSGNDTLILKITSTKKDNLIINGKTGDTLFFGSVCKYRDLYYFNKKLNDSSYHISAIKIDGKLIYGLSDSWLQFFEVDDKIIKGNNKKLVKYINSDTTVIRLRIEKRELKKLFNSIIGGGVPDTILNYDKPEFKALEKAEFVNEAKLDGNDYDFKVYPNPATDIINIELKNKNKSLFQLTDLNGRTILSGQLNELENKIHIDNQQRGIYILTIINIEKNEKESIKIIIK
jgi:hypothetical protein